MENIIRMKINGVVYKQSTYMNTPEELFAQLEKAYHQGQRVTCLCCDEMPLLYIAKRAGTLYLAKMPETGLSHNKQCLFYQTNFQHGAEDSENNGIYEDNQGRIHLNLAVSFTQELNPAKKLSVNHGSSEQSSTKKPTMNLIGLLHLMWSYSRNNKWFPIVRGQNVKYRSWPSVQYFLNQSVDTIINKGESLSNYLYIIDQFKEREPELASAQLQEALREVVFSKSSENKTKTVTKKLVVGRLSSYQKSKYGFALQFKACHQHFYMSDQAFSLVDQHYAWELSQLALKESHVIAIALVSASSKGSLLIEQCALMAVTEFFIPYGSTYEHKLIELLVKQERQFEKPLNFGQAEESLPNFVLNDANETHDYPLFIGSNELKKEEGDSWLWNPRTTSSPSRLPVKLETKPATTKE